MCHAISGVLTKDHVFFGITDSHGDIIEQHKLYEGAGRINIALFEITAPNEDFSQPLDTWIYRLDQDTLPEWYDAEKAEARARAALVASGLNVLYADYQAKRALLNADYRVENIEAKRVLFYADYRAKRAPLYADYRAKRSEITKGPW